MSAEPKEMPRGVTVIVYRDGLFAVSTRLAGSSSSVGYTQFTCGHVETGETFEAAAVRELKEETGLVVDPFRLVNLGEEMVPSSKGGYYLGRRYCLILKPDETLTNPEPDKHTDWRWVDLAELSNLKLMRSVFIYAVSVHIYADLLPQVVDRICKNFVDRARHLIMGWDVSTGPDQYTVALVSRDGTKLIRVATPDEAAAESRRLLNLC